MFNWSALAPVGATRVIESSFILLMSINKTRIKLRVAILSSPMILGEEDFKIGE